MNKVSPKTNFKNVEICPCGGGQSCIVDRRLLNDWVLEDVIFKKNNVPIRKNCYIPYSIDQSAILRDDLPHFSV